MYIVSVVHGTIEPGELRNQLDSIENDQPGPYLAVLIDIARAELQRRQGDLEGARAGFRGAIARFRTMGIHTIAAGAQDFYAWAELAGGEPRFALRGLLEIDVDLAAAGDRAFRSTVQATLAQVYESLGETGKARDAVELAEELTATSDLLAVVLISIARARLALRDGDPAGAEALATRALEVSLQTDMPFLQGTARLELARVFGALGRRADARSAAISALELFQSSGDRSRADWAQTFLDGIGGLHAAMPAASK